MQPAIQLRHVTISGNRSHQQTCILVPKFLVFSCVSVFPETQKHGNMENMLQLH